MQFTNVKVIQYNVLTSKYCTKEAYFECSDKTLDFQNRVELLKHQFTSEKGGIFCLQEVCYPLRQELEVFFSKLGYSFITSNYNHPWSGCMGTAIAFPQSYALEKCNFVRIADVYSELVPEKPRPEVKEVSYASTLLWNLGLGNNPYVEDTEHEKWLKFDTEMRKTNSVQILLRLKMPFSGKSFVVSTYHAPCKFWDESLMLMLTALPLSALEKFSENLPCILAGDFNSIPSSGMYDLCVLGLEGLLEEKYLPQCVEAIRKLRLPTLQSAHFSCFKMEPVSTTKCVTTTCGGKKKKFEDTLDYIFVSKEIETRDVLLFPEEASECLPNEFHPSDHRMIVANLVV